MATHPTLISTAKSTNADANTALTGRRLVAVRGAWVAVAFLAVGLFGASLPIIFDHARTICAAPPCADMQLTPSDVEALQAYNVSIERYAVFIVVQHIMWAAVWCVVGVVVFWRKSYDPMALLAGLMLVTTGATFTNASQTLLARSAALWLPVTFVTVISQLCFVLFLYLFPDGRFMPRWIRWVAGAACVVYTPAYLLPSSPLGFNHWPPWLGLVVPLVVFGTALCAQIYRYRRVSGPSARQQTKWVVFGVAAALGGFLIFILLATLVLPSSEGRLEDFAMNTMISLLLFPLPLSIGVAVLRSRLWNIDPLVNRTLVYSALTASVVAIYVLVVGYFGILLGAQGMGGSLPLQLLATGLVAVLFQPLRERIQRIVNRLMYGERDEPYRVLARLGQRLEATLAPPAVLPTIAHTIKDALKLPYAAVELAHGTTNTIAAVGQPVNDVLRVPLVYQGETVGALLLAPRAPGEPWSAADRHLLADLAHHAGVAVHGVRTMHALQQSRERLVLAREEERRRLRRDLHDDLAPTLAALALTASNVRDLIATKPNEATLLANELTGAMRTVVGDIRRLVYDLRPPTLDELGLVAAIKERAAQHKQATAGWQVVVDAPDQLPPCPLLLKSPRTASCKKH